MSPAAGVQHRRKTLHLTGAKSYPMLSTMDSTQALLREIEAFMASTGIAMSAFGEEACGNKHLVRRLRSGSSVTLPTADQIQAFMRSYRPGDRSKKRVRTTSCPHSDRTQKPAA